MISFESQPPSFTEEIERNRLDYKTKKKACQDLFVTLRLLFEKCEDDNLLMSSMAEHKNTIESLELIDNITKNIEKKGEALKNAIYQMQIDILLKQICLMDSYSESKEAIINQFLEPDREYRIKYGTIEGILYYDKKIKECQNQLTLFDKNNGKIKEKDTKGFKDKEEFVEKFRNLVEKGYIPDKSSRKKVHRIISMRNLSHSKSYQNLRSLNSKKSSPVLTSAIIDSNDKHEAKLLNILNTNINRVKAMPNVSDDIVNCFEGYKTAILKIYNEGNMNSPHVKRQLYIPRMNYLIDHLDKNNNEQAIKDVFCTMHNKVWEWEEPDTTSKLQITSDLNRAKRRTTVNPKSLSPKN